MEAPCRYEQWTISNLNSKITSQNVSLPKYQRGISWNFETQKKLISSIRNGYPIGSILLARKKSKDTNAEKYEIIDGLQRVSTIHKYLEKPTDFIGSSDDDFKPEWQEFCAKTFKTFFETEKSKNEINNFLHEFIKSSNFASFQISNFNHNIIKFLNSSDDYLLKLLNSVEFQKETEDFFGELVKSFDISQAVVPVILFDGEPGLLPEIFERLNTQGLKLSKYQIFAATWREECGIKNDEVKRAIYAFYKEKLEATTLEIEDVDEYGVPENFNLFDYLTGLGAVLVEKYPDIFDSEWNNFIAFQIATVAHKRRIGQMKELEEAFNKTEGSEIISTDQFTEALLAVCEVVSDALASRLSLKLNSTMKEFSGHAAFQISTIVTRLLVEIYDPETWKRKSEKNDGIKYHQLIRRWYLIDRLRDSWGNAGDSQFFREVWKEDDDTKELSVNSETMSKNSDKEELSRSLEVWFEEQLNRNDSLRRSVNRETKLVLRYFYFNILTVAQEDSQQHHIDHLVPISWWKKFFDRFSDAGGPVNSIGNLCLMIDSDNKSKRERLPFLWYEDTEKKSTNADFKKRCEERYFLIDPSCFKYPEAVGELTSIRKNSKLKLKEVQGNLIDTSKRRWEIIKKTIIEDLTQDI